MPTPAAPVRKTFCPPSTRCAAPSCSALSALRAIRGAGGGAGCAAADADAEEEEEASKLEGSLRLEGAAGAAAAAAAVAASASGEGRLRPELQIDTISSPNLDIFDGPKPLIRPSSAVERGQVVTWLG